MDSKILFEISKFLNKLEQMPLFQYFITNEKFQNANKENNENNDNKDNNNNCNFIITLKQQILLNKIHSENDIKNKLFEFYKKCLNTEGIELVEQKSLEYLRKYTKEKFEKLKTSSLAEWKTQWCKLYQEIATVLKTNQKAKLPLMRLNTDSLPMEEDEMLQMSNKIANMLNDQEKSLLIDLISTLESGTTNLNDECTFDLHDLKDETLYAIKTFLTKIEDKSDEAKFISGQKK